MKRSEAREAAFLVVFSQEFTSGGAEELIADALDGRQAEFDDFAKNLIALVLEGLTELDALIEKYSTNWRLARLPKTTLAVLRVAFAEITGNPDVPSGVAINEAVELAKKYATEEDAAYINGVLGAFVRARSAGGAVGTEEG